MPTLLEDLRAQVARLKAQSQTAVSLDELDRYLASRAEADSRGSVPFDFEVWRHRTGLQHESLLQTVKATLDAGEVALKATILINGGASVALLAFLGNVLGKEDNALHLSVAGVRWALELFVCGVFCSTVALAWRYFSSFSDSMIHVRRSQFEESRDDAARENARRSLLRWVRFGFGSTVGAILFGLGALAAFIWGGIQAAHSVW